MAESNANVVSASTTAAKLPDGVVGLDVLDQDCAGLRAVRPPQRRAVDPVLRSEDQPPVESGEVARGEHDEVHTAD